uniref:Uncharacterized protein n=1 Tax=Hyaloperonospora arabidopsidis (strain Emoy2) TaxID=559515 RepID=M4BKN7_HYAAE
MLSSYTGPRPFRCGACPRRNKATPRHLCDALRETKARLSRYTTMVRCSATCGGSQVELVREGSGKEEGIASFTRISWAMTADRFPL